MEGASRAAARRADDDTRLAYRALTFYGLAMKGKLKEVSHYLIEKPAPPKRQSPDQMFAILQQYAAGGAPINIRELN
jgi:hypothetical protein